MSAPGSDTPTIRTEALCKSFPKPEGGRLRALHEVDFEIEAGEFVALVGPSGSGKSTLMNLLGLLDRPDSGDYQFLGRSVASLSEEDSARIRNRSIGFVFQQFHLLPRTTATENVELPLVYTTGKEALGSRERAIEALCRVGLEDRLSHYPSQLSGGQQQRVAIARALVNDPELVLADEPTGNLDRDSGAEILKLLETLNASGTTLLVVTHDPHLAERASRVVRIDDGRLTSPH